MTTVTYSVPSISCGSCVRTIQTEVGSLDGVQSVRVNVPSKQVEVVFDEPASEDKIKSLLAEIDYPVAG